MSKIQKKASKQKYNIKAISEDKAKNIIYKLMETDAEDEIIAEVVDIINDKDFLLEFYSYFQQKLHPMRLTKTSLKNKLVGYALDKYNETKKLELLNLINVDDLLKLKLDAKGFKYLVERIDSEEFWETTQIELLTNLDNERDNLEVSVYTLTKQFGHNFELMYNLCSWLLSKKYYDLIRFFCIAPSDFLNELFNKEEPENKKIIDEICDRFKDIFINTDSYQSLDLLRLLYHYKSYQELDNIVSTYPDFVYEQIKSFDRANLWYDIFSVVSAKTQLNDNFYDLFYDELLFYQTDKLKECDGFPLLYFYKYAKDKDAVLKKINENVQKTNSVQWRNDFIVLKDTPIWDRIKNSFRFGGNITYFSEFYNQLSESDKKEIQNQSKYTSEFFDFFLNDPEFVKEKAFDVAIESYKDKDGGLASLVPVFELLSRSLYLEQIYNEIGLEGILYVLKKSDLDTIKDIMNKLGIDLASLDFKSLYENGKIGKNTLWQMREYKTLYEVDPVSFIEVLTENQYKTLEFYGLTAVSFCEDIIKKYDIHLLIDILTNMIKSKKERYVFASKIVDFFEKEGDEFNLTASEYVTLIEFFRNTNDLNSKSSKFYIKLVNNIPDELLNQFEKFREDFGLLAFRIDFQKNPINYFKEYDVPVWFTPPCYSIFDNIKPKILRELVAILEAEKDKKKTEIAEYIVTNLYPDDYLEGRLSYLFRNAPLEKKKHFVSVVGKDNLIPVDFEHLGLKLPRFEKEHTSPKTGTMVEEKIELMQLLLPLAKPKKATSSIVASLTSILAKKKKKEKPKEKREKKELSDESIRKIILKYVNENIDASDLIDSLQDNEENNEFLFKLLLSEEVQTKAAKPIPFESVMNFQINIKEILGQDFLINKMNDFLHTSEVVDFPYSLWKYIEISRLNEITLTIVNLRAKFSNSLLIQILLNCKYDDDLLNNNFKLVQEKIKDLQGKEKEVSLDKLYIKYFKDEKYKKILGSLLPVIDNLRYVLSIINKNKFSTYILKNYKSMWAKDAFHTFMYNLITIGQLEIYNKFFKLKEFYINYYEEVYFFEFASEANQQSDKCFEQLFPDGFETTWANEEEGLDRYVALSCYTNAKNKQAFVKKLLKYVDVNVGKPSDLEWNNYNKWDVFKDTIIWDYIKDSFHFTDEDYNDAIENFALYAGSLSEKELNDESLWKRYGRYFPDFFAENPKFIEYAINAMVNEINNDTYKHTKLRNFILNTKSYVEQVYAKTKDNFIRYVSEDLGVNPKIYQDIITTEDLENYYTKNKDANPSILYHLKQYKMLYKFFPDKFTVIIDSNTFKEFTADEIFDIFKDCKDYKLFLVRCVTKDAIPEEKADFYYKLWKELPDLFKYVLKIIETEDIISVSVIFAKFPPEEVIKMVLDMWAESSGNIENFSKQHSYLGLGLVDYFEQQEITLTKDQFNNLLSIFGVYFSKVERATGDPKCTEFYSKLIVSIPDDQMESLDLDWPLFKFRKKLKDDPENVIKELISNLDFKVDNESFEFKPISFSLFKSVPLKSLNNLDVELDVPSESFASDKPRKLRPLQKYIITEIFPDNYLRTKHVWAFKNANDKQKKRFVNVVGIENLTDTDISELNIKQARFERKHKTPKLSQKVVDEKLELFHLLLPLAKAK